MFKSKLKASSLHFFISLTIFSAFIFVLYFFWFPEPYFSATGGWQGLQIVALVDLVLGPLLTFIVFNHLKAKKELITDLSIIVVLQFFALIWGIYTVSQQRPIAITFFDNSFYTVPVGALNTFYPNDSKLIAIKAKPRTFYYINKPTTIEGINAMYDKTIEFKVPPQFQIELFGSFQENFHLIKEFSLDIKEIINTNKKIKNDISTILAKTKTKLEDNVYLPLRSKYHNIIIIFDQNGKKLGYAKSPYFKQ